MERINVAHKPIHAANNPEEQRSQLRRGGSLKSRKSAPYHHNPHFNVHFNAHPCTSILAFLSRLLFKNFRTNLEYIIYYFRSCHMPCPSYQPRCVYHEPPLYAIFYSPCISSLLGPNILLSIQFSDSLNRYSSLKLTD